MKYYKTILVMLTLLIAFSQVKSQATSSGSTMNNVLTAYYGVKNALAQDNSGLAQIKAKALLTAINAVPAGKPDAGQNRTWAAYSDKLRFDSRHISESTAIDHQREHFTSLSKNLYEVLKAIKFNTAIVYEQYCPMKKATWLSETSAISNPYLGKEMPDCGKTTATLNIGK